MDPNAVHRHLFQRSGVASLNGPDSKLSWELTPPSVGSSEGSSSRLMQQIGRLHEAMGTPTPLAGRTALALGQPTMLEEVPYQPGGYGSMHQTQKQAGYEPVTKPRLATVPEAEQEAARLRRRLREVEDRLRKQGQEEAEWRERQVRLREQEVERETRHNQADVSVTADAKDRLHEQQLLLIWLLKSTGCR